MTDKEKTITRPLSNLTLFVLVVVAIYRIVFLLAFFFTGALHSNRYTYWNYSIGTVFYILLATAYIWKVSYLFKILSVFVFPLVFGSAFFVLAFIIIITQLDGGWMFLSSSILAGGSVTLGTVHTVDAIVHFFTVIDLLIVLMSGYFEDARWSMFLYRHFKSETYDEFAFRIYYIAIPLVPMLIYTLFFNAFKEYPTDTSPIILIAVAIALLIIFMTWLYEAMTRHRSLHHLSHCEIAHHVSIGSSSSVNINNQQNHQYGQYPATAPKKFNFIQ